MWVKIRNIIVPLVLNEATLKAFATLAGLNDEKSKIVATAIMDVKYFVDTKDKRYVNQAIDTLQQLIKQLEVVLYLASTMVS